MTPAVSAVIRATLTEAGAWTPAEVLTRRILFDLRRSGYRIVIDHRTEPRDPARKDT